MRTLLTGELAQAQDSTSDYYVKLEIQNGSGTWIDVGAALGTHWLINVTFGVNVDQTVSQATFTLIDRIGSASLAPLMSTSPLNVDDHGAYAPLLDIGRLVRANIAAMAHRVALDVSKYREAFTGRIDDVSGADSADFSGPITVACSDLGAWLNDIQIETPDVSYGSEAGIALETVLQSLLTDNIPSTEPAVTLVKESASSFAATAFKQSAVLLLEALTALVLDSTGEDLRYRYDASHVSQLTWFNPDRTRVTVDATFAANQYLLRTLGVSIANVRNAIRMPYTDAATGSVLYATATDLTSIDKYRRRFNEIPASSLITDLTSAQKVVNAVANDLSDAPAQVSADLPFFFWPVQLYDRYTFTANNRQYDQDQTFGVVGYQHTIQNGQGATSLTLAGRIVGAYAAWLGRLSDNGIIAQTASILRITPSESTDGTTATLALVVGAAVDHVQAYYRTVARNTDPALAADFSDTATLPVDGTLIQRPVNSAMTFDFPEPTRGNRLIVRLVPFYLSPGGTYAEGESVVVPVEPAPPGINAVITATRSGNLVSLSATLAVGASDVPGTFAIIETVLGVDTTLLTITPVTGALNLDPGVYTALASRPITAGVESVTWRSVFTDAAGQTWTFDAAPALPALVPGTVTVGEDTAARTATITATLTDSGHYLNPAAQDAINPSITGAVTAHTTLKGVTTAIACTSIPGSGTSGNYVFTLTLDPTRQILVTLYRHYVDGSTDVLWDNALDSNKISDVLNAVPTNNGTTANVFAQFDNDTATGASCAQYSLNGGSTWTAVTVAGDFTATITGIARTTSVQSMIIQGKNAIDGLWGNSTTIPIDPYTADVPSLTAQYKPLTSTTGQIIWTCTLGSVTLSIDGGTPSTPSASPIAITLDGLTHDYAFVATLGSQTMSRGVNVPALPPSALPIVYLWNSAQSTTADTITMSWTVTNTPSSPTYDLLWSNDNGATITTIAGVTSPYVHTKLGTGGHGYDIVAGGTITTLQYAIVVKSSGVTVAQSAWRDVDVDHA